MEPRSLSISKIDKNKIIVILGPTASGKSDLAIEIAKKYAGEIISADSRQVYRGMDLGTGKVEADQPAEIPKKFLNKKFHSGSNNIQFISDGIRHHMLNILNPRTNFSAAQFKKKAQKIIADILKRKKLPIICGGTGFWIKAFVDNVDFPEVKPDFELRKELEKETAKKLFLILKKLDFRRAKNIDKNNKVRLIRAIEICKTLGKVPTPKDMRHNMQNTKYDFLQIGIQIPREKLNERIKMRLKKRFNQNMVQEITQLHREGISWKRLEAFGLEYRWIARFLQNKISRKEMEEKLYLDIIHYAKRQMTWFQKDKRIKWIKNQKEAAELIEKFLNL